MKRTLLITLLLFAILLVQGQDYKMYLDTNGNSSEFTKAASYIVVKEIADTAWLVQQYDMENSILQSAMFKDKGLKIPNGKSTYYWKLNSYQYNTKKFLKPADTMNYVMSEGEFSNGNKIGWWINYSHQGKKEGASYYSNGVQNGPYRAYNSDGKTIRLSGTYINGLREGYWQLCDPEGKPVEIDRYRKDKMIERKMMYGPYNPPKPPNGFETYVNRAVKDNISAQNLGHANVKYLFTVTITTTGIVTKIEYTKDKGNNDETAKVLIDILKNSPQWKPANTGDETKPVEDFTAVMIKIDDGNITTGVMDAGKVKAAYYYLNH